jgi:uncharacterized protein (DUF342 family)
MEQRFESIEKRLVKVEDSIFNLHNTSMAFVNQKFEEMERRFNDKIDEKFSEVKDALSASQIKNGRDKLRDMSRDFGWLLAIAAIVVDIWLKGGHP